MRNPQILKFSNCSSRLSRIKDLRFGVGEMHEGRQKKITTQIKDPSFNPRPSCEGRRLMVTFTMRGAPRQLYLLADDN